MSDAASRHTIMFGLTDARRLVGLARAASVHLMPQAELFMIYLIMAAVLMFRPEGLFKRETARRI